MDVKEVAFLSATRLRILSIELSERGKGRHPPSEGSAQGNLKLDNKCKQERQEFYEQSKVGPWQR